MLINSSNPSPMPERSFFVGDVLVRRVADSAELVVFIVTTKAGAFVGNINQTWYRRGLVSTAFFSVVGADGVRSPENTFSSLAMAAESLAPCGVLS